MINMLIFRNSFKSKYVYGQKSNHKGKVEISGKRKTYPIYSLSFLLIHQHVDITCSNVGIFSPLFYTHDAKCPSFSFSIDLFSTHSPRAISHETFYNYLSFS